MKLLRMEFFKCRRRKIALICLAFVAVQLAWMGRTLTQMEPGELTQGWMSLLYNLAVIDAVMLPLTISALASRNCELEHKGSAVRPVPKGNGGRPLRWQSAPCSWATSHRSSPTPRRPAFPWTLWSRSAPPAPKGK